MILPSLAYQPCCNQTLNWWSGSCPLLPQLIIDKLWRVYFPRCSLTLFSPCLPIPWSKLQSSLPQRVCPNFSQYNIPVETMVVPQVRSLTSFLLLIPSMDPMRKSRFFYWIENLPLSLWISHHALHIYSLYWEGPYLCAHWRSLGQPLNECNGYTMEYAGPSCCFPLNCIYDYLWHMCMNTVHHSVCGYQRIALWSWFSRPTCTWLLRIKLGCQACTMGHWMLLHAEPPRWTQTWF